MLLGMGRHGYGFFALWVDPSINQVIEGEIFPLKVRAKALSMTTASNWYVMLLLYKHFSLMYYTKSQTQASQLGHCLRNAIPRQQQPRRASSRCRS